MKAVVKKITPFISVIFFVLAIWFLDQELRQYAFSDIVAQLSSIPNSYIVLSVTLSLLSYLILTLYDGLGVRYIGEKLAPARIMRAGFIGYAFSHNIGMALITGGSIRYRIYSAWGFSGIKVTQIVGFSALTLWLGFCMVAGLSLTLATPELPNDVDIPFDSLRVVGFLLLAMVVAYLWASKRIKKELTFRDWSFTFPGFQLALKQVVLASIDWIFAALVLYVLLPEVGIRFASFVGVFLLAQIIGLFSQVPGGLGVFESVMLLYLANFMSGSTVMGILVVYRIIYYLLPLLIAVIMLAYQEYLTNRRRVQVFGKKAASWIPRVVPQVLSITVFIGGSILLFSGSLPSQVPRMEWLQLFLPLPVIEMSHFFASLVGVGLMLLARSLQRRIEGAYHFTIGLLIFGILFSLMRGADYEEATLLAFMLVALLPSKGEFHRKSSMMNRQFSPAWIVMISLVMISAIWLGFFSYRNVAYQEDLWWQFTLLGDAPRYLRAMVGVLALTLIIGLMKLLKPASREIKKPETHELETVRNILAKEPRTKPNIGLLEDKEFMFSSSRNTFLMFAREGGSYITMGDPAGSEDEAEELIWKYYEFCGDEGVHPVFYQVREDYLDCYVDLGLTFMKLGEEARVYLPDFKLQNLRDPELAENYQGCKNLGYRFEILDPEELDAHWEEFERISQEWVAGKKALELGFSQGTFKKDYLKSFPFAVIYKEDKPVVFSNIWRGANKHELSFDLVRNTVESPEEVIDYLLLELMLWGKSEGYRWFSLGVAPLSGMNNGRESDHWSKVADWIYTYGDHIYSFKEARSYRERFNPYWEPRFLVAPGGLSLPRVLKDLTNLIYGGFRGLL